MRQWFKELFCFHDWDTRWWNRGYYSSEAWYECTKCGKTKNKES